MLYSKEDKMTYSRFELSLLCDRYGSLLTEKQRQALELSCNEDYSLAEIAELTGISRQGVRDQIQHAKAQLIEWEEKLGLQKKYAEIAACLQVLEQAPAVREEKTLIEAVKQIQTLLEYDAEDTFDRFRE